MRKVMIVYRSLSGQANTWVVTEDKLDHIMSVCDEKNLEVIDIEYLR